MSTFNYLPALVEKFQNNFHRAYSGLGTWFQLPYGGGFFKVRSLNDFLLLVGHFESSFQLNWWQLILFQIDLTKTSVNVTILYSFDMFFLTWHRKFFLTLSWRRPLSYRNQSIDLLHKSMDWFLYDNGLRHKRVKKAWLK